MNTYIVEKLQQLKQHGASWLRDARARKLMEDLRANLPDPEFQKVDNARDRYLSGDGREALDHVCNELIGKYRSDVDPRTFTKTLL